jgi:hypothetical protein
MVSGKMGKSEFIQFLRTSSNSIAAQCRWLDPLHLHGLAAYGAKCPPFSARTRVRFAARSLAFKCIPRRNRFRHNPRRRNESQSLGERHIGNRKKIMKTAPSNIACRISCLPAANRHCTCPPAIRCWTMLKPNGPSSEPLTCSSPDRSSHQSWLGHLKTLSKARVRKTDLLELDILVLRLGPLSCGSAFRTFSGRWLFI